LTFDLSALTWAQLVKPSIVKGTATSTACLSHDPSQRDCLAEVIRPLMATGGFCRTVPPL
jgi:hypothetical protein